MPDTMFDGGLIGSTEHAFAIFHLPDVGEMTLHPCCSCTYVSQDGLVLICLLREGPVQHLVVKLCSVLCVGPGGMALCVASSLPQLIGESFNALPWGAE